MALQSLKVMKLKDEMIALGKDMLQFFGLGCRNVSKIYLPEGYDLNKIFGGVYPYSSVIETC